MIIKVKVDKRKCFRRGIDYNSGVVKLDLDPAKLDEKTRNWIADRVPDGYEYTPTGTYPCSAWAGICPPDESGFLEHIHTQMSRELEAQGGAK